jgi:hypothetical protein
MKKIDRNSANLTGVSPARAQITKGLFKESERLRPAGTSFVQSPLSTAFIVASVVAGLYGTANVIKYLKHKKTGTQALKDTVARSAGIGVSTGMALTAANAIAGTSLAFGSTVVVPLVAATAVAYTSKILWDKVFFSKQ